MKLQAINVGQGDCFILEQGEGKNDLIIDTGGGKVNFTTHLDKSKNYDVLLTHSHQDHIGGFKHIIQEEIKIDNIYVPLVFNELYKIFYMIVKNAEEYLENSGSLYFKKDKKTLDELETFIQYTHKKKINIIGVYHGHRKNNIVFLNPFIDNKSLGTLVGTPEVLDLQLDKEYGLIEGEFKGIELDINDSNYRSDRNKEIVNILLFGIQEELNIFLEKKDSKSYRKLSKKFHKLTNKFSIVFQYDKSILMTGDAEIDNFELIMKSGLSENLESKLLKVPHHGSRSALNEKIINFINPKVSIISHKNRYGHPHCEVMRYLLGLKENNIYMTNAIISTKCCTFSCVKGRRIFFPGCGRKYTHHKKIKVNIYNDKLDFSI